MKRFLIIFLYSTSLISAELRMLYEKNPILPSSKRDKELVNHVKISLEQALSLKSKLSNKSFIESDKSVEWRKATCPLSFSFNSLSKFPFYHLLNNLCSIEGATHLHVGLLAGNSFIAALYENQETLDAHIGVDWFKECPLSIFSNNCKSYIQLDNCKIMNSACFEVDKSSFKNPIDIYFYDADHSLKAHEMALTYYDEVLADVFVLVIDDFECPWIRGPTFKAFDKMNYQILYENVCPVNTEDNRVVYLAVIKKSEKILKGLK